MARLFFALWPDTDVSARIGILARTLPLPGARVLAETNIHMTLAFLGNVDAVTADKLASAAAQLSSSPFSLCLDQLGWWKKPKIAWLAPSVYPDALPGLALTLHSLALEQGLSMDERPYHPHVTLARKVTAALVDITPEPIAWNIKEFCLVESKSTESGVKYQVKRSWPLKIM